MDTVSECHAEAPQATVSEGLAQGPYVAARVGVEPTTIRLRVIDLTSAPPRPQFICPIPCEYSTLSVHLPFPHLPAPLKSTFKTDRLNRQKGRQSKRQIN